MNVQLIFENGQNIQKKHQKEEEEVRRLGPS